ncbi:MAG: hypothetical protein ACI9WC_003344 [Arenicella sp.]|jgi:hypothetical protein
MSKSKKYDFKIEQVDSLWRAQITRQVTSKKVAVTKQKADFESESDAKQWAENELIVFTKGQADSNARRDEQRKESEETQRLRSLRRADKTLQAKAEKAKEADVALDETGIEKNADNGFDEADD